MEDVQPAYTTEEVARLLSVTVEEVVGWGNAGKINFFMLPDGSARRYPREPLDRLLKGKALPPPHALPSGKAIAVSEVMHRFGVERATVNEWIARGLLSYLTLPTGAKRVFKAEVDALFEHLVTARVVDYEAFFVSRDLAGSATSPDAW